MRIAVILTLALAILGSASQTMAAGRNYAPAKVIAAMKVVNPKLKIIIAHRGAYGYLCPENSKCAIDTAVNNGSEAIEIDVKESADGTPWPSHDITVGRGTTFTRNSVFFDPYHHFASNDANNPEISSLHDADLRKLALRDVFGNVANQNKNISLQELMAYVRSAHNNVVIVFDIKYPQSVKKVAQIVKTLGLDNQAVLKFSATFFNPLDIVNHTLGLAFAPTLYAPQLDGIADHNFLDQPPANRVHSYMHAIAFVRGFTYFEIGNKMFLRNGSSYLVAGPTSDITVRLVNDHYPVGNFIPVIEHNADARSPQTGFYHTDGYCCTRLIDFLAKTKYFGNEERDDRTDLVAQVRFNENVITDNAVAALNEAQSIGSRQEDWKIMN